MNQKKYKRHLTYLLIFALLLSGSTLSPNGNTQTAAAAQTGLSFDSLGDTFGQTMNTQMERYLNGDFSSGDHAEAETDLTYSGFYSRITFHMGTGFEFPLKKDDDEADAQVLRWVSQAIANYPNLCSLFTLYHYTVRTDTNNNHYLQDITLYSPLRAGEIIPMTASYKKALTDLISDIKNDNSMETAEKIRAVHDRIILKTDYVSTNSPSDHIPLTLLSENRGVCQSYSCVFNHAMLALGVESLFLMSTTHAWNAVRVNGKWYYVDVTWDDPVGGDPDTTRYTYFLIAPSDFSSDHNMTDDYAQVYGSILSQTGNSGDIEIPEPTKTPDVTLSPTSTPTASPLPTITPVPKDNEEQNITAPAKTKITSLKNKAKKKLTITWKKMKNADGYRIACGTKANFKGAGIYSTKDVSLTLKNRKKKKYYVKVRAFVKNGNKKIYGKWSAVKTIRIRK